MLTDTTDTIKSRMIRTASGVWGFADTQDINSFDPIVGMIIGALAEELHKISGEIKKTDARLVEKLHELLFNQSVFSHFPAHAIARANPTQARVNVSELYQFSFVKKIPRTVNEETFYENKSIFFTPTANLNLCKGEVKYFAGGNQLFKISNQVKESLIVGSDNTVSDYSRLYLGVTLDKLVEQIDGLNLMFTIRNKQNEERFYQSLSTAGWKLNGKEIVFKSGFQVMQPTQLNTLNDLFRIESDISFRTCSYVNDFYQNRFVMVDKGQYFLKDFLETDALPGAIRQKFPLSVLKTIPNDIFWIEIELSQPVSPEIISNLSVSMNCFPVINRKLNEFSQLLTQGINIIPLTTDELFFDIFKIADTRNTLYKSLSSFNRESDEEGYMIRQEGIARFDSRDAQETISHLVELIRDERSRFAVLGTDVISSELKQLDQIISRLEQRLESSQINNDTNSYLLLNCKSNYERASVQFWSTSGELANNIKADSKLTIYSGSDLDPNSVFLCSNSFGGRQKLTREDKMNKLRRAILSKGRIVTREDIKALCFEHFGPELVKAEIKDGVQLDNSLNKGLIKTLDIYLGLTKNHKLTEDDLNQKIDGLKIRLRQESVNLLPYRVFIRQ